MFFKILKNKYIENGKSIIIFMIVFNFLYFLFFNVISPLREEIIFHYDISVFYVIGKAMKNGLLPYRDLFDHKGPYTYLLFYLGSLISENYHIGLYIIFSIYYSIIGIFIYKILNIYLLNKNIDNKNQKCKNEVLLLSSLFSYIYMFNDYTANAGFAPEQMSYPLVIICYYLLLENREKYYNKEKTNDTLVIFVSGVVFGILFFIKMNHCIFLVPIAIIYTIDCIKNKNILKIFKFLIIGILGIITSIAPAIIYMYLNGIIKYFYENYILFNINYAHRSLVFERRLTGYSEGIFEMINTYKYYLLMTIISVIIYIKYFINEIKINNFVVEKFVFYILIVVFSFIEVFSVPRSSGYYVSILVLVLMPLFVFIINNIYKISIIQNKNIINIIMIAFYIFLSFNLTNSNLNNNYIINFREDYNKNYNTKGDPFINVYKYVKYKLNGNEPKVLSVTQPHYYLHFSNRPSSRFFYRPIVERNRFKEYYETVEKEVMSNEFDIIMITYKGDVAVYFSDMFFDYLKENYDEAVYVPYSKEAMLIKKEKNK